MKNFKHTIKTIINYLNPFYEYNKQMKNLDNMIEKMKSSQLDYLMNEVERIRNMSDEDKKIEHDKILKNEANIIINKLESNPELYRVFNNILRRKKFKDIEDNKYE